MFGSVISVWLLGGMGAIAMTLFVMFINWVRSKFQ